MNFYSVSQSLAIFASIIKFTGQKLFDLHQPGKMFSQFNTKKVGWLTMAFFIASGMILGGCQPQDTPVTQDVSKTVEFETKIPTVLDTLEKTETPVKIIGKFTQVPKTLTPESQMILTKTQTPVADTEQVYTPTLDTRLPPDLWREWTVLPVISDHALQIYQLGIEMGNNPKAFSKVGDCQSIKEVLMGIYDQPTRYYLVEQDLYLQESIDNFAGSFNRDGMAVKGGFNAASVLSPMWADPDNCQAGETPLECEIRVHKPSIVIISLEVWFKGRTIERYESYMRQIIEYSISHGVVPILTTKADNVEGDHSINLATAKLAYEYDIPLWNFWLAVQWLDNHGIDPLRDGFHISVDAWNVRSYTGLRIVDRVWRYVREKQVEQPTAVISETPTLTISSPESKATPLTFSGVRTDLGSMNVKGKIIFGLSKRSGTDYEQQGVFIMDLNKQEYSQILGNGFDFQSVSPNNQSLLINQGNLLYISDLEGLDLVKITDKYFFASKQGTWWFPDGKSIAMITLDNGWTQIMVYNLADQVLRPITKMGDNPVNIYPSSSTTILYWEKGIYSTGGGFDTQGVWWVNLDNNQNQELAGVQSPAFSPDMLFFAYTGGKNQEGIHLFISKLDRSFNKDLIIPGDHLLTYVWSPDGKQLAILTMMRSDYFGRASAVRIFVISTEDWGIQEHENINGLNDRVKWSPDNQNLFLAATDLTTPENYQIVLRILNPSMKKMVKLEELIKIVSKDFPFITREVWIP